MADLKGMCVPVCTPFTDGDQRLDEHALRAHIDSMIEAGVHIILACGGTGEFAFLSGDEKKRIVEIAARHIDGRAALMVQTSALRMTDTIEFSKHAEGLGADGLLVLPPYFEGPDEAGVIYHYETLAKAVSTPIMVYNIPQASNFDITPALFTRLLEIDTIKYIKDSTGDFVRIQQLLQTDGIIFNGCDALAYPALAAGCPGCVWGAINAMPEQAVELYDLVSSGDLAGGQKLWSRMLPAQLYFWTHTYNPSVKTATNLSGRRVGDCRLPVLPLTDEQLSELTAALAPLGLGPVQKLVA